MTGPLEKVNFGSLESQCLGNIDIRGKQNSLFPLGPVIKCLIYPDQLNRHTQSANVNSRCRKKNKLTSVDVNLPYTVITVDGLWAAL